MQSWFRELHTTKTMILDSLSHQQKKEYDSGQPEFGLGYMGLQNHARIMRWRVEG